MTDLRAQQSEAGRVLGVAPDAPEADIRKAFRTQVLKEWPPSIATFHDWRSLSAQALRWHPDKNGGSTEATEQFLLVTKARDVLLYGEAEAMTVGAGDGGGGGGSGGGGGGMVCPRCRQQVQPPSQPTSLSLTTSSRPFPTCFFP
jgi:DnaJ-class molecular chaperone